MIQVKNSTQYYINERALTFSENDLDNPNRVAVSLVSGTVILVHVPGTIDFAASGNYDRWTLKGYSTRLVNNAAHYVYARLNRADRSALVVFSVNNYNIDGSITTVTGKDENGKDITSTTEPSEDYYFIRIGELTATDGASYRELTYDSGLLSTAKGDSITETSSMWELDKNSVPPLIKAKQWLHSFTVKFESTFLGGLVVKGLTRLTGGVIFKKDEGSEEKAVTDIKRSTDSDEEFDENGNPNPDYVPISDDTIPTTLYTKEFVENELEKLDDRYLSKLKDDYTPFSLGVGGSLDVQGNAGVGGNLEVGGDVRSKDFAEGVTDAGYAMFKDGDGHYRSEADIIVARILANVYDLLVKNNAVFKGDLSSEEFISGFVGGKGWAIRMKEWLNAAGVTEMKSVAEFDDLVVRGSMRVYEFIVSQLLGENDNRIFTGMMEVDHYDASDEKVYLKTDGGKLYNPFRVDDVIIVQQYGGMPSEDSSYYVTKQYEFIVTEVGVGSLSDGENRLDWVRFRSFTTSMEGGDESLIAERDTLVRIDNLSDARRKGIVQIMSVGEDTPYMDFVYGAKTDPDDSLKGRLGNIGGVYNPLFGWLKEFGAYLTNLYAVGEFRIAHTGEDVADAIEMAKGSFRTNYRQTTYDMTEEDNFLTNASFTDDCEGWILGEDSVEYFLVDGLPQYFNYELYASEKTAAVLASYNDRDMLRLFSSSARQSNDLIRKPGTHKEYSGEDGVTEVVDKLYLNVRFYCHADGDFSVGFADSTGTFYDNVFHSTGTYEAGVDAYTISLSGTWDSIGDFYMKSTGDIYVDSVSLTDKPLENYKIETSTRIEQDATKISLLGQRISGAENSITNLGIELDAAEERITAYVDKEIDGVEASVSQLRIDVDGISTRVATAQGTADNAQAAADAAQKAADDAAADALAAQKTADTASSKAAANATAISQNSQSISAVAAAFQKDANGNLVLTSAAGAVITSEVASLYATKETVDALGNRVGTAESSITTMAGQIALKASQSSVDALGKRVTTAEASIKVNSDNISLKVSKDGVISAINQSAESVVIKAERVDLTGVVSFSNLNKTLGDYAKTSDLDGYATDSELATAKSELNTAITNLNDTLSTKIDAKAEASSVTSLTTKVNELNTALSGKADTSKLKALAYQDLVEAALCGSTLIYNGYLNTDYCRVSTIEAVKGTIGKFDISNTTLTTSGMIDEIIEGDPTMQTMNLTEYGISTSTKGNIYCTTNFGLKYGAIIDTNYYFPIEVIHGIGSLYGAPMCGMKMEMKSSDIGIYVKGGSTHILSSGITKIYGLAVNPSASTGTAATNVDFITISSGSVTLPSPALCPGKVYFVKKAGGTLTIPNFIGAKSTISSSTDSKSDFENRPYIFISNGSAWFEFYCCWD